MLSVDRDALLCDLAETYGIYAFTSVSVTVLATLAVGLRDNSRIKMKMRGERLTKTEMLLAAIVDRLSILVWHNTENGKQGINPPKSVLDALNGNEKADKEIQVFDGGDAFDDEWERITGVRYGA